MNNKLQNTFLGMLIVAGIVLCALLLASGKAEDKGKETSGKNTAQAHSTATIVNMPTTATDMHSNYAVVTAVNAQAGTISFRIFAEGKDYNFRIDEPIYIYSAYDTPMTLAQLDMGDVAYIVYEDVSKTLCEVRLADNAAVYDVVCHRSVSDISINPAYRTIAFYNKSYEYSSDVVVVSNGRLITPEQLAAKDVLTVYELDGKVVSIVVVKGHGYLTLTGADLFMDGYLDIGGEIIRTVKKDMMVMVTEGSYKVAVSHGGYYGAKTVKIERDKVAVADFSEIVAETIENGNVLFDIDVEGAKLYLNGEETDYAKGVLTLPVGSYSVRVSAEGYENYVDKIDIIADYQKISIKMTPDKPQASETESAAEPATDPAGATSEYQTETATKVSDKNRVYIDGPAGAIIYFDGAYLGIAPLDFAMVTGEHTFFVLSGAEVRSYVVNLAEGADDVRYDFTPKSDGQ